MSRLWVYTNRSKDHEIDRVIYYRPQDGYYKCKMLRDVYEFVQGDIYTMYWDGQHFECRDRLLSWDHVELQLVDEDELTPEEF